MIKIINKNGKKIPNINLPKRYCGERVPYFASEYLCVGKAFPQSSWRNITLEELEGGRFKVYQLIGKYLYPII
jgi:hypothetical protein